jgi:hypothetical protein
VEDYRKRDFLEHPNIVTAIEVAYDAVYSNSAIFENHVIRLETLSDIVCFYLGKFYTEGLRPEEVDLKLARNIAIMYKHMAASRIAKAERELRDVFQPFESTMVNNQTCLNPEECTIEMQEDFKMSHAIQHAKKEMTRQESKVFRFLERGNSQSFVSNRLGINRARVTRLKQSACSKVARMHESLYGEKVGSNFVRNSQWRRDVTSAYQRVRGMDVWRTEIVDGVVVLTVSNIDLFTTRYVAADQAHKRSLNEVFSSEASKWNLREEWI